MTMVYAARGEAVRRIHAERLLTHLPEYGRRQAVVDRTCNIDGCDKPMRARGWCRGHYQRWRDGRSLESKLRGSRGVCQVEGCDEPHSSRGFCSSHYDKFRRHGDPQHIHIPPVAENAPNWRGDDVAYSTVHSRLTAQRGSASERECAHCGESADRWAYDHQDPDEVFAPPGWPYSMNLDHYMPLCNSCHSKFDRGRKKWL